MSLITLPEIFEDKILRIPDYQRGFSWAFRRDTKQMNDLWTDLQNMEDGTRHFMGIVALEKINAGSVQRWRREFNNIDAEFNVRINDSIRTPHFVVDGQQRLVSLTILLFLLSRDPEILHHREAIENMLATPVNGSRCHHSGYEVDTPSHQFLIRNILEDQSIEITEPETLYTRNLVRAKEFFSRKLEELGSFQKRALCEKLRNQLYFHVLNLDSQTLDISLIFETLNYRGKPLSKLELFKNRLMYLVTKRYTGDNEQTATRLRRQITKTWLDVYEWLGKSPNRELDDDEFLRAFWIMFYDHHDRTDSDFELFEQDIFEEKYKISNVNLNDFIRSDNLERMLDALSKAVKYWFYMHFPEHNFTAERDKTRFNYSDEIKEMLKKIFRIPNKYGRFLLPVILSYFLKTDHQQIYELLKAIERHNYCVYLFAGRNAKTNRAHFSRMANPVFRFWDGEIYRTHTDSIRETFFGNVNQNSADMAANHAANHELVISEISVKTNRWVNWDDVYNHIHQNHAGNEKFNDWIGIKYTMWEFEEGLRGGRDRLLNYASARTYQIYRGQADGSFQIAGNRERREKLRFSLGNILIGRTERTLRQYSNLMDDPERRGFCERDCSETFNDEAWSEVDIFTRGLQLLAFIENRWEIRYSDVGEADLELKRRQLLLDGVRITADEQTGDEVHNV